ncbi:hypothetical protein L195_g019880, partial [Trifolium pratense]
GLASDASFISVVENVNECRTEVTEAVNSQIKIVKETMEVQEEILGKCFNEERRVDDRLELLHKELKPLLKRKRALQSEIRDDVTKLISRRHSLMDLLDKQKGLWEDLKAIYDNVVKAKRAKQALEEMHRIAIVDAKDLGEKNAKIIVAKGSKSQREKKKVEVSTSRFTRSKKSKEVKVVETIILSSDTSDSDSTDEDYAEFLKTYDPQESYPRVSSSGEEDGFQRTVESKMKPPEPSKTELDSDE